MDVTVCVGTFGDPAWETRGRRAAAVTVAAHPGVPVHHVHASTLHEARNCALEQVSTEHVCFLDADDELEAGYFQAVGRVSADLRVPRVRYVPDRKRNYKCYTVRMPHVAGHAHHCRGDCLPYGNWMVIGTVAPTSLIRKVGGFRDWPIYEDWDLWLRCWQAGATVMPVRDAIYRAHVRHESRNRGVTHAYALDVHRQIAAANGAPIP